MQAVNTKRRVFLGTSLFFSLGTLSWFNYGNKKVRLYSNEIQVLLDLAYHLYPTSKIGPGAKDIHIAGYLAFVLKDERILKEDREYFLKGAFWLEESAFDMFDKSFINLNNEEKEKLLGQIKEEYWGKRLIYTSLNYIFEALLCAPVYGSNPKQTGWTWLEHNPGFPQPTRISDTIYDV